MMVIFTDDDSYGDAKDYIRYPHYGNDGYVMHFRAMKKF